MTGIYKPGDVEPATKILRLKPAWLRVACGTIL